VNVLCLSTDYPPGRCGGYELQCRDTGAYLRRHGHRVRVLAGASPRSSGDDARDDVHRELPRFSTDARPLSARAAWAAERRAAAALRRHLATFRPDVVCLWRLGDLSMSLVARVRRSGVPAVGVVCDPWMIDGPRRDPWTRWWAARPVAAALGERAGAICRRPSFEAPVRWLFVSAALREQVRAAGLPVGAAEIVPAGVDLAAFPLAPMTPWAGRLLYAGRLSPLKGVDTALMALTRLGPEITLEVAGSGEPRYERELRELAAARGVASRVRFRGFLWRRALASAYAAADALLFPVRWQEPFGLVPLEAMASGTPVVAVAAGGAAAYLEDGRTALAVPPDDPAALATAVGRLQRDDCLRATLRANGRRTAERYPANRSHARIEAALVEQRAWPPRPVHPRLTPIR
jgi:glycogen synthase